MYAVREVGWSGRGSPAASWTATSESPNCSANRSCGIASRRSSHSTADAGAAVPSTRIDAGIAGSTARITEVPSTALRRAVSEPVGAVSIGQLVGCQQSLREDAGRDGHDDPDPDGSGAVVGNDHGAPGRDRTVGALVGGDRADRRPAARPASTGSSAVDRDAVDLLAAGGDRPDQGRPHRLRAGGAGVAVEPRRERCTIAKRRGSEIQGHRDRHRSAVVVPF